MPNPAASTEGLTDTQWDILLTRIKEGHCTPFLGSGASWPTLPLGGTIAAEWADAHDFPFKDERNDLPQVAQYLAVSSDEPMYPKELIARRLNTKETPDFTPPEPHAVLARLPFPVYLTTNYDDFMYQALVAHGQKDPRWDICRWNASQKVLATPSALAEPGYEPSAARPLVYHLHGRRDIAESLVLTEDDYFDFLVGVSREAAVEAHQKVKLPARILEALSVSLLFVGYRLADWNVRVVHRGLIGSMEASLRRGSLTVQLEPEDMAQAEYLQSYFKQMDVRVFWGTAEDFMGQLLRKWEDFDQD